MTMATLLEGWMTPTKAQDVAIHKYSTTGDILAYKRCRRAYGFFNVRGFSNANATQAYFGSLVHDVLDRIHRIYGREAVLPNEEDVGEFVAEAHERLIRAGIRPYNSHRQQETARRLIYRFVTLIGPHFFPHVRQAEYHLERVLKTQQGRDYVLSGVVDILSGAVSHALGLPFSTEPDDVEIWDYKSGRMPDKRSRDLRDYEYQMCVYAELYRQQTGDYPARSVLVFVGELGDDSRWDQASDDPGRFPGLVYPVHPTPKYIHQAMEEFHQTVEAIEAERLKPYGAQWQPPDHDVDQQTCEACDLRYNCSAFTIGARQRSQPL